MSIFFFSTKGLVFLGVPEISLFDPANWEGTDTSSDSQTHQCQMESPAMVKKNGLRAAIKVCGMRDADKILHVSYVM